MNKYDQHFPSRGEAKVRYGDNEVIVVKEGDFVRCAVTNDPIPLSELRYWNVRLQEPYKNAEVSLYRYLAINGRP